MQRKGQGLLPCPSHLKLERSDYGSSDSVDDWRDCNTDPAHHCTFFKEKTITAAGRSGARRQDNRGAIH